MSYQKLFQVSPKRQLGMLEGVLPTNDNEIYAPSLNYPVQGAGITCSKPYVGYEGDFEMTVGRWKNSGWSRPDAFAYNPSQFAPTPTGNCGTGMCNNVCTPENVGDAYSNHIFLPNQPKDVQLGMKNYYVEQYGNNAVKDLDIIMYYSNGCGFCTQAKKMLKQAGVADFITFYNSREHPLPKGVNGVPHFVSKKTGKSKTGAPRSVEDLVEALSVKENFGNYYEFKNYTEPGVEAVASIAGSRVADQYPCGDTNTCLTGKCPLKNPSKYVGIMGV